MRAKRETRIPSVDQGRKKLEKKRKRTPKKIRLVKGMWQA